MVRAGLIGGHVIVGVVITVLIALYAVLVTNRCFQWRTLALTSVTRQTELVDSINKVCDRHTQLLLALIRFRSQIVDGDIKEACAEIDREIVKIGESGRWHSKPPMTARPA